MAGFGIGKQSLDFEEGISISPRRLPVVLAAGSARSAVKQFLN